MTKAIKHWLLKPAIFLNNIVPSRRGIILQHLEDLIQDVIQETDEDFTDDDTQICFKKINFS